MTVRLILQTKGSDVLTTSPEATLGDVVRLLSEKRIGAVVVADAQRRVVGILSERDVVRVIGTEGPGVLDTPVSQTMTHKVITCVPGDTVTSIMEVMTGGRFRHIPVVDEGKLVGIISIGDVVKHRLAEMERESHAMREYIMSA